MKKFAFALGILAVVLVCTEVHSGDKKGGKKGGKLTAKQLVGTYQIVAGERGGKEIPKEEIDGSMIRFSADTIVAIDKEKKNVYAATYKLESNQEPARIHMVSIEPKKGQKAEGLIKKEGGTLKLIYALPGGKAPTDFKAGPQQQMFVLKKQKEAK